MVIFTYQRCPHCQKLAPTWEILQEELKNDYFMGKVECLFYL